MEDYLLPEPVVKLFSMKIRAMADDAFKFIVSLFCCFLSKKKVKWLNSKIDRVAKIDREVNKGLRTIKDHLDVESIIKLH